MAYVTVQLDQFTRDHNAVNVRFDVDLHGLPDIAYSGHEVVVDFQVNQFNNNGTFYTDSNGLHM